MEYLEESLWEYIFKPICYTPAVNTKNHLISLGLMAELGGSIIYILGVESEYDDDILDEYFHKIEEFSNKNTVLMSFEDFEYFDDIYCETETGCKLTAYPEVEKSTIIYETYDEEDNEFTFRIPESYLGDEVIFKIGIGDNDTLVGFAEKIIYIFKAIEYTMVSHIKNGDKDFIFSSIVEEIETNIRNKEFIYSNEELDKDYIDTLNTLIPNENNEIDYDYIYNTLKSIMGMNNNQVTVKETPVESSDKSDKNTSTAVVEKKSTSDEDGNSKILDFVQSLIKSASDYITEKTDNAFISAIESNDIIINKEKKDHMKVPDIVSNSIKRAMNKVSFAIGKKINMDNSGNIIDNYGMIMVVDDDKLHSLKDYECDSKNDLQIIYDWYTSELINRGLRYEDISNTEKIMEENKSDDKSVTKSKISVPDKNETITSKIDYEKYNINDFIDIVEGLNSTFIEKAVNINTPYYIDSIKSLEKCVHEAFKCSISDMYINHKYPVDDIYEISGYYDDFIILLIDNKKNVSTIFLLNDESEDNSSIPDYKYYILSKYNIGPRMKQMIANIQRAYNANKYAAVLVTKYAFQILDLTFMSKDLGISKRSSLTMPDGHTMLRNVLSILDCALNLRIIQYKADDKSSKDKIYNSKHSIIGKFRLINIVEELESMIKSREIEEWMIKGLICIFDYLYNNYFPYTTNKGLREYRTKRMTDKEFKDFIEKNAKTYVYIKISRYMKIYYNASDDNLYIVSSNENIEKNYNIIPNDTLDIRILHQSFESIPPEDQDYSLMTIEDFNTLDKDKCKKMYSASMYAFEIFK